MCCYTNHISVINWIWLLCYSDCQLILIIIIMSSLFFIISMYPLWIDVWRVQATDRGIQTKRQYYIQHKVLFSLHCLIDCRQNKSRNVFLCLILKLGKELFYLIIFTRTAKVRCTLKISQFYYFFFSKGWVGLHCSFYNIILIKKKN